MRRFYVEELTASMSEVTLKGAELRHMKSVLRLVCGERVSLFDGKGLELIGLIESYGKESAKNTSKDAGKNSTRDFAGNFATIKIVGIRETKGLESRLAIRLVQGLVKGEKPEFIIQKATELGVSEIVLCAVGRSVPEFRDGVGARVERWRKVALEAAKQCGRAVVPTISVADYGEALKSSGNRLKLVFQVEGREGGGCGVTVADAVEGFSGKAADLLIGPEGGLTEEEAARAALEGFTAVTLGPRTLRAETAAMAAVALVQHLVGDMG